MEITLFSLFPHWFDGPLGESVIQRARDRGLLSVRAVNFRDWATDKHHSVDDIPYGGGGGMVLRPEPLAAALDQTIGAPGSDNRAHVIHLSPRGRVFKQQRAIDLAKLPRIAIICGHYEALDQRLIDSRVDEEISLGDFVLTGGEIPAMAIVDAIARMIPGVLGNDASAPADSFMNGLLEGPHYTRPEVFENCAIPEILLSGNHAAIAKWREDESLRVTYERRRDLHDALLLHPEQTRRLARRARPFAIWRLTASGEIDPLFICSAVTEITAWRELLAKQKFERGLMPGIRLAEIREAKSGDESTDRARIISDAKSAESQSAASRFVTNLLREMGVAGGNPITHHP